MLIKLLAGELEWTPEGTHVWDSIGKAIRLTEDKDVEMEESVAVESLKFIRADREFRGCDPDTGLPLPEPAVEELPIVETPVVEAPASEPVTEEVVV